MGNALFIAKILGLFSFWAPFLALLNPGNQNQYQEAKSIRIRIDLNPKHRSLVVIPNFCSPCRRCVRNGFATVRI